MKGYELILLANAVIFLGLGALTYAQGTVIERQGEKCSSGNATQCDRDLRLGGTMLTAAPILFAFGLVLGIVGVALVLRRRWRPPTQPERPEEEPGYP